LQNQERKPFSFLSSAFLLSLPLVEYGSEITILSRQQEGKFVDDPVGDRPL
jgi:hypothetical protein